MKKTCEYYMEQYLGLDKNQRITGDLRKHLLTCSKCQAEVKVLSRAERLSSQPLEIPVPLEDSTIQQIVAQVDSGLKPKTVKKHNTFGRWIASGLILAAVLGFISYISRQLENSFYSFFAFMMLAIGITAYISLFFASNLDFFVKRINTKSSKTTKPTA